MLRALRYRVRLFFALLPLRYRPATATLPAVRELQEWHNRVVLREWPAPKRRLILALERLIWPLWSVWLASRETWKWGRQAARQTGRSWPTHLFAALRQALIHRLPPADYYAFNFWRHRESPADYLTDGRPQLLFRALNRGEDVSALDDKKAFWSLCQARQLATPPVLLAFADGKAEQLADNDQLGQDLFFKLRRGLRGAGAVRWFYNAATGAYTSGASGATLDRPALIEHYRQRSSRHAYLVQPRLYDHPALADLSNETVCVVRMITVVRSDGKIGEFASILKMPTGPTVLTNLADGAVFSPVDSARGILRQAFTGAFGKPTFDDHPINGVRIVGRVLPNWREAQTLVCAAHAAFPGLACIGWDVVLTPQGPVLLEGNHGMAISPFNLAPNVPLGRTELPAVLTWHLKRKYGPGSRFAL